MLFIDYVTLLLISTATGLLILADYLVRGAGGDNQHAWSPAFLATGLISFISGLHMIQTWPLPGAYNSIFGEASVFFGAFLLGMALCAGLNWWPFPMGIFAFFTGAAVVLLGARFIGLGLSQMPIIGGLGLIFAGSTGILLCPAFFWRRIFIFRLFTAIVAAGAAALFLLIAFASYWVHMEHFQTWQPVVRQTVPQQAPANQAQQESAGSQSNAGAPQ